MALETINNSPSRFHLSLNIGNLEGDSLEFILGNFTVLCGSSETLSLSMLLCVKAQLSYHLGGLKTKVIFVDGGNTFRLYEVSYIAQLHKLNPRKVLERIFVSRAFTAYQMTTLVFEKLQAAIDNFGSKLVIISDIGQLYSDKDLPQREAIYVFNQLTAYLSKFARENHVIILATHLPSCTSKRSLLLKTVSCGHANVILSVKTPKITRTHMIDNYLFVEKPLLLNLESKFFPHIPKITLSEYMEA
ncbi:MAG: hypothetical protein NWF11_04285 [Candidatus Bathyarchaeota archaeon]|nr:hypothetical protein [Candidatus Bathyarchaeota archaeon]